MAACQIPGHPDSYGLGIRIAFYVQWFGIIVTSWILPSDALNLMFLNGLTTAATAIGLAINIGNLQPAEILVVLLLVCGALYAFVPLYAWKMCTLCRKWWDPEPWDRIRLSSLFKMGLFLMYGVLLCVQLWFWSTGVHHHPSSASASSCPQYGFIFAQVRLDNAVLITFNIGTHFAMLVVGTWMFACWVGLFDASRWYRRRKKEKWRTTPRRIRSLQECRTISDIIVGSVITTAIELLIMWNNISNVNNLDTAAQLIPMAISAVYVFRSFYIWLSGSSSWADPYGSVAHTAASSIYTSRPQGYGQERVLYFRPGRSDWTRRRSRRHSHQSSHYHYSYDDPYVPEMTNAAPSAPDAIHNQHRRSATVADEPVGET